MDLEKYEVLMKVIQSSSFTKAAEETGYTVSGISRLIAALEKEQGFPLIYRNHDGIKPSKELEMLLPYLQDLLHQQRIVKEMSERIRGAKFGIITIGVAYSSYYNWIAGKALEFQKINPDIAFQFVDGYSSELLQKMDMHELDVCLISKREGTHHIWKKLGEEELVMWLPKGHPLAPKKSVSLSIVEKENYIDIYPGKDIDNARVFSEYKITPNSTIAVGDSFAAYSMVEAGLGITLNHKSNGQKWIGDVVEKPLRPKIAIPVGLCIHENSAPLVKEFWDYISAEKSLF